MEWREMHLKVEDFPLPVLFSESDEKGDGYVVHHLLESVLGEIAIVIDGGQHSNFVHPLCEVRCSHFKKQPSEC